MKQTLSVGKLIALTAVFTTLTVAGTIGPSCGSCNGGIYSLTYTGAPLPDADPLHETYRITFTVDGSGWNGPSPIASTFIQEVAVKVSSSLFSASLFSAPNGTANWSLVGGGINANGCSGSGSGFECSDWIGSGQGVAINGGLLSWVFDLTMNNGLLDTSALGDSIKARYVDGSGDKVGALVSEEITLTTSSVPEPSSMGMVLIGLAAAAWRIRKRA